MEFIKIQAILEFNTFMRIVFKYPRKRKEYVLGKTIEVNELEIFTIHYN